MLAPPINMDQACPKILELPTEYSKTMRSNLRIMFNNHHTIIMTTQHPMDRKHKTMAKPLTHCHKIIQTGRDLITASKIIHPLSFLRG
jgi:hypothetical protein